VEIDGLKELNSGLLLADPAREGKFGCTFAPGGYSTKK
jgi:hypothetical protein